MPQIRIDVITEPLNTEQLSEELAKNQKVLKFVINGNIDFENIRARSIKAENIEVGAITAEEIAANSITADKMSVEELSAITANLGEIDAGTIRGIRIFGSYIATAEGTFPRIEFDNEGNLLVAYKNAQDYIALNPTLAGATSVDLYETGIRSGFLTTVAGETTLYGTNALLALLSNFDVIISPGAAYQVKFPSWDKIFSTGDDETLEDALDSKAPNSGFSGTITPGQTINVTNGRITSVV